ncbi:hypothetical protein PP483_gp61 [Gordonia phage Bunnybear]|uniref:Oxidoreductase n=1 Tax=Gordonia phage Bunnybear TaxID=2762398 RepID=A0A7G8LLJ5_9CAUD|nr:hypothetical protein PP483_gp61 [Gordonia phage Bunnybear]QNJ58117.1 hypothetical protein SEA_BUNNYBEAR_61 [Gordonia phage Bunnybear]
MACEQELCANWDGIGCPCAYLDTDEDERPVVCGYCQTLLTVCAERLCCPNCTHPYPGGPNGTGGDR